MVSIDYLQLEVHYFALGTAGSSCFLWYYNMPRSIECRAGTHFFTACQVKVPCNIETEVDWYWNPLNMPNKTLLITNSGSNGTRIKALPNAMCSSNASTPIIRLYILSLTGLNNSHAGYYWCQLRVVNYRGSNPVGELLPSNQCYVGVRDMAENCDYGEHTDTWMCAQKESVTAGSGYTQDIRPTLSVMLTLVSASPTVRIAIDSGPSDNSRDPFIEMSVTILEMVFLVVIVICMVIIAFLFCCLFRKHRRGREGKYKYNN